MRVKDVNDYFKKKMTDEEYKSWEENIFAPPLNAQVAVNMLCKHFLGPDWYSPNPLCNEQINTEIVCEIINQYKYPRGYFKERKEIKEKESKEKVKKELKEKYNLNIEKIAFDIIDGKRNWDEHLEEELKEYGYIYDDLKLVILRLSNEIDEKTKTNLKFSFKNKFKNFKKRLKKWIKNKFDDFFYKYDFG